MVFLNIQGTTRANRSQSHQQPSTPVIAHENFKQGSSARKMKAGPISPLGLAQSKSCICLELLSVGGASSTHSPVNCKHDTLKPEYACFERCDLQIYVQPTF